MEEFSKRKITFKLPSGKPATVLNNLFEGYIYDPVYMKLECIAQQEGKKYQSDFSTRRHRPEYVFGPGGRAEELQFDFLKDNMPDATYAFLLNRTVEDIFIALSYRAIFTYKERQQMD